MSEDDQKDLHKWIRQRDANAFKDLTSRYSGLVYATCLRITGDRAEAEDVTQECFERLASVPAVPRAPLGPWLHRGDATRRILHHCFKIAGQRPVVAVLAEPEVL